MEEKEGWRKDDDKSITYEKQLLLMQTNEVTHHRKLKDEGVGCNAELVDSDCEKALKSSKKLYSLEEAFHDL